MALYVAAAGAVMAQWLAVGFGGRGVAAAAAATLLVCTRLRRRVPAAVHVHRGAPGSRSPVGLCGAIAAAALAAISGELTIRSLRPPDDPTHVAHVLDGPHARASLRIEAEVTAPVRRTASGLNLIVEATRMHDPETTGLSGRVHLIVRHARRTWEPGDRVIFRARLRRVTNFGNPGEFDWARWNAHRGVFVSAFVWDGRALEQLPPVYGRRTSARRLLVNAILDGGAQQARALVAALVTGDRRALDRSTVETVRAAGLSHVLAISGLHMGLVAGAMLWAIGRGALRTRAVRGGLDQQRVASAGAAAALLGYAAVSGGGISVARSLVMAAAALVALWRGRAADGARALAWAAIAMALVLPGRAGSAAFQLSFVAVAVLLLHARGRGGTAAAPPVHGGRAVARAATRLFFLATIAWAATTPLVAQHFQRISLVGPFVNVAAAVPVAATVLTGLAGAAVHALSPVVAAGLFSLSGVAAGAVLTIAKLGARLPGAGLDVPSPGWSLAVALVAVPFALGLRATVRGRALAALGLVVGLLVGHAAYQRYRADRMDIVFVAVGQGDATIVRLPGGAILVVDGGRPGRGRIAVAPVLRRMHVTRIDYLVVTHVQSDHWGGIPELVSRFEVGELWYGGGRCDVPEFVSMAEALRAAGSTVVDVGAERAGRGRAPRRAGRAGWSFEAPWPVDAGGSCAENDRSVVLRLTFRGRSVLLPGDVEAAAETALVASAELRADLLKAPHHGSRTSSTPAFVAAVAPAVVVASVGAGNHYGFPHPEVERGYAARGARLFRTDDDGAVLARIDATGVDVRAANRR